MPENPGDVRQSAPAPGNLAEGQPGSPRRSHAWVPPVVALVLLLLLLATLLWPDPVWTGGGAGDGPAGSTGTSATAGDGRGASDQTGAGAAGTTHGRGTSDDQTATADRAAGGPDAGFKTDTDAPPDTPSPPVASAAASSVPTPDPAHNRETPVHDQADAQPRPERLGFQSDLLAPPPAPPKADPTPPVASDPGTAASGLASFFGQTGRGSRFVFVIDRSGSMKGGRFDAARFELIKSIRGLGDHESFSVVFYDSRATPMPADGMVDATEANKNQFIEWVRTVSVGGGTNPTEALTVALRELRPDTIWLLSDGRFNVAVADTVRQLNPNARVQINTIAFQDRGGEAILKIIADENDGDYRFVEP